MKGLLLCNKGIEDITAIEVKEIIKKESAIFSNYITFNIEKIEELCKVSYLTKSIKKAILVMDEFEFSSEEDILKKARKLNLKDWLDPEKSFKVETKTIDSDISNEDIKGEIGRAIIDSITSHTQKVDLENPDITIYSLIIKNKCFLGIDFTGFDLSKREYRIFSHAKNIKSTIAYAMVRFSGFKKKEILLDPFSLSGTIPIEAALYQNNFPVHFYAKEDFIFNKFIDYCFEQIDKQISKDSGNIYAYDSMFKNVDAAKKNAKIAGINKTINFSRLEMEWLDTKFDKRSVDRIVTCLPNITKYSNEKDILNIYK